MDVLSAPLGIFSLLFPMPVFLRSLFRLGRLCALVVVCVLGANAVRAAEFVLTDDFVRHLIEGRNAYAEVAARKVTVMNLGLRADGKFYPYSTPAGRRIGYELSLESVYDHTRGITRAEAEARLRAAALAAATRLVTWIPEHYSGRTFEQLDAAGQEMLVDYALSEGVEKLPPAFVDAVYQPDRVARLGADGLHLRWWGGMMQILKNRAFGYRWLGN